MTLIKKTTSVCAVCLDKVAARVVDRDGEAWMIKHCPEHGEQQALLSSDAAMYWQPPKQSGCGPGSTGPTAKACCGVGHSCTLIFEVTEHCNLKCPTCFTDSSPQQSWHMGVDEFSAKLDALLAKGKGDSDIVQLSGGEPTVHPHIERMIEICFERGIDKVYLNSNGVRLARDPDFVERLAALNDGDRLQIYLQLDGMRHETHSLLRGARGLAEVKQKALTAALDAGIYVLPVMTVTRHVNLDEIGDVVRLALQHHPKTNCVMLQPAFYAGRYENEKLMRRLTIAELTEEVEKQLDGMLTQQDFIPLPCGHPMCFALAVGLVKDGAITPVSRYFPRFDTWGEPDVAARVAKFADRMPQNLLEELADDDIVDQLLADDVSWSDHRSFFMIGIKPFMDANTYDQDRIDECCVHVVDRAGNPVSLCEYNTTRRPRGRA